MATLLSYIESVADCKERFRTIRDICPATGADGQPLFSVRGDAAYFRMKSEGVDVLLRCPLKDETSMRLVVADRVFDYVNKRSAFLSRCRFLKEELLVYGMRGQYYRIDVITEQIPAGAIDLPSFVRRHLYSGNPLSLRRLLEGVHAMAVDMSANGITHGRLKATNIFVTDDFAPLLTDWAANVPDGTHSDGIALARIVAVVYTVACEPDAYRLAGERDFFRTSAFGLISRHLKTQAEFSGNTAMLRILDIASGVSDTTGLMAALGELSSAPFSPMPLLLGLLGAEAKEPVVINRAAAGISSGKSAKETTPKINFEECEFVGALSDTMVRFCFRGGWGFADRDGRLLSESGSYLNASDFYEGRAIVRTADGFGMIDRDGAYILAPRFECLEWFGPFNVAAGCDGGRWELYDRGGRALTAGNYDWISDCLEGIFAVRRGGRYGYIRRDGSPLTDMKFDEAYSFRDGKGLVVLSGSRFTVDTDGRIEIL